MRQRIEGLRGSPAPPWCGPQSCGVGDGVCRVRSGANEQVRREGRAWPESVLRGIIEGPTDGFGRNQRANVGQIISSQPQLSTAFFPQNSPDGANPQRPAPFAHPPRTIQSIHIFPPQEVIDSAGTGKSPHLCRVGRGWGTRRRRWGPTARMFGSPLGPLARRGGGLAAPPG